MFTSTFILPCTSRLLAARRKQVEKTVIQFDKVSNVEKYDSDQIRINIYSITKYRKAM